jgi:hypothetical protein
MAKSGDVHTLLQLTLRVAEIAYPNRRRTYRSLLWSHLLSTKPPVDSKHKTTIDRFTYIFMYDFQKRKYIITTIINHGFMDGRSFD